MPSPTYAVLQSANAGEAAMATAESSGERNPKWTLDEPRGRRVANRLREAGSVLRGVVGFLALRMRQTINYPLCDGLRLGRMV